MMEKFTFIDYNQFSSFMQNKDFQANNIVIWEQNCSKNGVKFVKQ